MTKFERNQVDEPSVNVEELGLINNGASDEAIATITGSYPHEADTYNCNDVCDMLIYPVSGVGQVIVQSAMKRRRFSLNSDRSQDPIEVLHGEGYYYSAAPGQELVVKLESTPPWTPEQYRTVQHEDY